MYTIEAKSNEGPFAMLTASTKRKANYNLNLIGHGFAFQLAASYAADGCIDKDVDKWARSFQVVVKRNGKVILNKPLLNLFYDIDPRKGQLSL